MPVSMIPSFLSYCYINAITPGPANLLSLTTAMNEGKQAALRQWRGLFAGFWILALVSVFTNALLGSLLGQYVRYLAWIGAAYLIWMAISMVRKSFLAATSVIQESKRGTASFWTGLIVQLTNAKVIIFCMTALSSYVLPYTHDMKTLLLAGAFLPFTGPVCNLIWLFSGVRLKRLFDAHRKPFSIVLALSLIYCAFTLVR